jgi:SAM-dependent methyltransferase
MESKPVSDVWGRGDPYEQYVGRWSRQVAPRFLSWLNVPSRRRWLDVGCGTGALSAAILDGCSPVSVTGVEPSEGFLQKAKDQLAGRVLLRRGNAEQLPLEDGAVDVAVSGLVLNFVPDASAALREMVRVTRPGGTIAAYVWDYSGKMEMMRHFWDAAVEIDPAAAKADEGARFAICRPDALAELFAGAGLNSIEVTSIDITTAFASFDEYWRPFLGGQGPAPAYAMALDEKARADLRDRIRARLPLRADGSLSLIARSWAMRGTVVG